MKTSIHDDTNTQYTLYTELINQHTFQLLQQFLTQFVRMKETMHMSLPHQQSWWLKQTHKQLQLMKKMPKKYIRRI